MDNYRPENGENNRGRVSVRQLEESIWAREGVRVVARCSPALLVSEYVPEDGSALSVTQWVSACVAPLFPEGVEVVVFWPGTSQAPHPDMTLRALRRAYAACVNEEPR